MADPVDIAALKPGVRTRFITLGLANVATQVTFPKWCRRVSGRWVAAAGAYADQGTDGEAISAEHQTVPANELHSVNTNRSGGAAVDATQTLFFSSPGASTVLRLTLEPGAS